MWVDNLHELLLKDEEHIIHILEKVHEKLYSGKNVGVHCIAGVSRSASLVIMYLMKHCGLNLDQAYSHVKRFRHIVEPNRSFMQQLEAFYNKNCIVV